MLKFLTSLYSNISSLNYLPHAIIYFFSSYGVKDIISCDIRVNILHSSNKCISGDYVGIMTVARSLKNNSYLRTLFFHRIKHLKIRKILWGRLSRLEIPHDVHIGRGVKLDHPFSTILNARSIGSNLRIKNNITIGNKNDDENLRPIIGNDVYIGAGAIIIGNITIGNNVTIGAGCVVIKNLPDNCIAVGNPARIINK